MGVGLERGGGVVFFVALIIGVVYADDDLGVCC